MRAFNKKLGIERTNDNSYYIHLLRVVYAYEKVAISEKSIEEYAKELEIEISKEIKYYIAEFDLFLHAFCHGYPCDDKEIKNDCYNEFDEIENVLYVISEGRFGMRLVGGNSINEAIEELIRIYKEHGIETTINKISKLSKDREISPRYRRIK